MIDETILYNLREARENGYDLACSFCGVGIGDESDEHDYACPTLTPEFKAERAAVEAEFAQRLGRILNQ